MTDALADLMIELVDPRLSESKLQDATQNLRSELQRAEGVRRVDFVSVDQAPADSKGFGGFVLGLLQAEVSLENIAKVTRFIADRTFGRTIKIAAKDANTGRELAIEICRPEDLDAVLPKVEEFLKG